MTVAILIGITLWDRLAPASSAFEVDVVGVGAGINDIGSYALTTLGCVEILLKISGCT